jgi:hypothetical protein
VACRKDSGRAGLTLGLASEMTASIDQFCADGFLVVRSAVAPHTVRACVDVIENELRARVVDPRDPKTGPSPSSASLAPKVPLSQQRARRQRSGKCTTRASDQAAGFSAKESVGPFPFDSQA